MADDINVTFSADDPIEVTFDGTNANILPYTNLAAFPTTGQEGILYEAKDTNKIYRWNVPTLAYVELAVSSGGSWGSITGTLSNQTDLNNALNGKISHSLSTATNDFLVGSGSNTFIKKTLAETQAIIGMPIELTQAQYTALSPPITGQTYFIYG